MAQEASSAPAPPRPRQDSNSSSSCQNDPTDGAPNLGLHAAATSGNLVLVKYALENGQPANCFLNSVTPLHAAATTGNTAIISLLLAFGADVNALRLDDNTSQAPSPGAQGSTPLHFAAANGHIDAIRVLLEHGALPAAADGHGNLPSSLATLAGHAHCVELINAWVQEYGPAGLADILPGSSAMPTDAPHTVITPTSSAPQSPSRSTVGIRSRKSLDHISSAAAGVKAAIRSKRSNPSLKTAPSNPLLRGVVESSKPSFSVDDPMNRQRADSLGDKPSRLLRSTDVYSDLPDGQVTNTGAIGHADVGFSTATTPRPGAGESKRRPSMPSIFEKAAHPASSLRAALGSNSSKTNSAPIEGSDDTGPSSVRLGGRLSGKRSLSNLLRKATGSLSHAESNPNLARAAAFDAATGSRSGRSDAESLVSPSAPATNPPLQPAVSGAVAAPSTVFGAPSIPARGGSRTTDTSIGERTLLKHRSHGQLGRPRQGSNPLDTMPLPRQPPEPQDFASAARVSTTQSRETDQDPDESILSASQAPTIPSAQSARRRTQSTATPRSSSQRKLPPVPSLPNSSIQGLPGEASERENEERLDDVARKERLLSAARQRGANQMLPNGSQLLEQQRKSPKSQSERSSSGSEPFSPAKDGKTYREAYSVHQNPTSASPRSRTLNQRSNHAASGSTSSNVSDASSGFGGLTSPLASRPPVGGWSTRTSPTNLSDDSKRATITSRLTNRPSNSSIRSASVGFDQSAAEQAQAIMRNADLFGRGAPIVGDDGKTVTLAAQLAAYGEALAREQQRGLRQSASTPNTPSQVPLALAGLSSPGATSKGTNNNLVAGRNRSGSGSNMPSHLASLAKSKGVRHESSRETLGPQMSRGLPSVWEDQHGLEADDGETIEGETTSPSASGSTSASSSTVPSTIEGSTDPTAPGSLEHTKSPSSAQLRPLHLSKHNAAMPPPFQRVVQQQQGKSTVSPLSSLTAGARAPQRW